MPTAPGAPGPDGVEAARGRDGGTRLEGRSPQAGGGPPAGAMATRRRARLPIEQVYDYRRPQTTPPARSSTGLGHRR